MHADLNESYGVGKCSPESVDLVLKSFTYNLIY